MHTLSESGSGLLHRPVRSLSSTDFVVVSGHEAASRAACGVLSDGGSVADAAVCGAAVLGVVLPNASAIGGDVLALYHDASNGLTAGLNSSGYSPAAADAGLLVDNTFSSGPLSITAPGAIAGWQALHDRFGRLPWRRVLAPAIDLARNGFPVSPGLAAAIAASLAELRADKGCSTLFLENGAPISCGATLRQPALADCLEGIAKFGAAAFYEGSTARSIADAVADAGGLLSSADLARTCARWETPIGVGFAGSIVRTLPPNSSGLYLLLQLGLLEGASPEVRDLLGPKRFDNLIHAAGTAFEVGDQFVADPVAAGIADPAQWWASESDRLIQSARRAHGRLPVNEGGTAALVIANRAGESVSLLQSVMGRFGARVADPQTGVLLNNRMGGFCTDRAHPNFVGPLKQPAHSLTPAMIFENDRLHTSIATPGGPGQTVSLAQVIQALRQQDTDPIDAIATPRWSIDRKRRPMIEDSVPAGLVQELGRRHPNMTLSPAGGPFFGSVACIVLNPGSGPLGIADSRRETSVVGQ